MDQIWRRQVVVKKLRLGNNQGRRSDYITRKRLIPIVRVQQWGGQLLAEVSLPLGLAGNYAARHDRLPNPGCFQIGEEESLVSFDGAAEGAAELIALQDILLVRVAWRGLIKSVPGIEDVVPQEFESVAMKLIGATFDDARHYRGRVPELCVGVASFNLEFLNSIDVRLNERRSQLDFSYVSAIQFITGHIRISRVN